MKPPVCRYCSRPLHVATICIECAHVERVVRSKPEIARQVLRFALVAPELEVRDHLIQQLREGVKTMRLALAVPLAPELRDKLIREADELLAATPRKPLVPLRVALQPFARVVDAYEDDQLEEVKPSWGCKDPGKTPLLNDKDGSTLLTLQDFLNAKEALKP